MSKNETSNINMSIENNDKILESIKVNKPPKLAKLIESKAPKIEPSTRQELEVLISTIILPEWEHKNFLALIENISPPQNVGFLFQEIWQKIELESKERLVEEILKLNSDKALLRQVAIAHAIVGINSEASAKILHKILTKSQKTENVRFGLQISKEKKEAILNYFFNNLEWSYLVADDYLMKPILDAFIQIANDQKFVNKISSKAFLRDFSKWAVTTLNKLQIDIKLKEEVLSSILTLPFDLPGDWVQEIKEIIKVSTNETVILVDANIEQSKQEITAQLESLQLKEQNLIGQLAERDKQILDLQEASAKLEQSCNHYQQAWQEAKSRIDFLQSEKLELSRLLEQEKAERVVEQGQFAERIEREIKFRLNDFKGKAKRQFQPIFDNLRPLRKDTPNVKTAEFLLLFLTDFEEKMKNLGILIS